LKIDLVAALTQVEDVFIKNFEDVQVECQIINTEELLAEIKSLRD
jgi:hypothetical protein